MVLNKRGNPSKPHSQGGCSKCGGKSNVPRGPAAQQSSPSGCCGKKARADKRSTGMMQTPMGNMGFEEYRNSVLTKFKNRQISQRTN